MVRGTLMGAESGVRRRVRGLSEAAFRHAIAERVVLHRVDAENGEGVDLARAYHVAGYPTFVLMMKA